MQAVLAVLAMLVTITVFSELVRRSILMVRDVRKYRRESAAFSARQQKFSEDCLAALAAGDIDLVHSIKVDAEIDGQRFFERYPVR